jgi:hypothetical protein
VGGGNAKAARPYKVEPRKFDESGIESVSRSNAYSAWLRAKKPLQRGHFCHGNEVGLTSKANAKGSFFQEIDELCVHVVMPVVIKKMSLWLYWRTVYGVPMLCVFFILSKNRSDPVASI